MTHEHGRRTRMQEDEVVDRLRELAGAARHREPSPDVEARLMRAWGAMRTGEPHSIAPRRRWLPAIAASIVLATTVTLLVLQTRALPPRLPAGDPAPATAEGALEGFVPVPGAAALPRLESASIVRYELPMAALPAYGVDILPDALRRAVQADLLIGQDGYARAIRLAGTPGGSLAPSTR